MRDKYYRVVKSLVEYLGNKMPPKPHKQAAIHALMLQHWDRVRTAQITPQTCVGTTGLCVAAYPCNLLPG